MHNFITAATNLMVFLIGALSSGDSIANCHIARVFQHSSILTPRHNLACALVMSYMLKEPDMMFTNALNRTNNNQISRDCRIESGSGVSSRKKGLRKLETT